MGKIWLQLLPITKKKVPFGSIKEHLECPHLGGKYKKRS